MKGKNLVSDIEDTLLHTLIFVHKQWIPNKRMFPTQSLGNALKFTPQFNDTSGFMDSFHCHKHLVSIKEIKAAMTEILKSDEQALADFKGFEKACKANSTKFFA